MISIRQTDTDDVVPLFLGHVKDHVVAQDTRDLHHDVQLAESVGGSAEKPQDQPAAPRSTQGEWANKQQIAA
jgi:hypothetical protein